MSPSTGSWQREIHFPFVLSSVAVIHLYNLIAANHDSLNFNLQRLTPALPSSYDNSTALLLRTLPNKRLNSTKVNRVISFLTAGIAAGFVYQLSKAFFILKDTDQ